jgi:hypothetical protein
MLRLLKVACPGCGAAIRIDPRSHIVTCGYCKMSSYVHRPKDPPRPEPEQQSFGHIQVRANAFVSALLLWILLPTLGIGGLVTVVTILVALGGASRTTVTFTSGGERIPVEPGGVSPVPWADPAGGEAPAARAAPAGKACEKAVACCKAVVDTNPRSCEALRALDDAACQKQYETLSVAARARKRPCD